MNLFKTLIIEDSLVFRQTFKKVLGTKFPAMEIAEAADGKEALEKLTSFQPRLIFLDVKLPDGNGLELTRKIKAQDPSVMILILTSYDIPEYREAALRSGARNYFVKGLTPNEDIWAEVESILKGSGL
jgi:DNA-binding NarL/FixJ family response regulator